MFARHLLYVRNAFTDVRVSIHPHRPRDAVVPSSLLGGWRVGVRARQYTYIDVLVSPAARGRHDRPSRGQAQHIVRSRWLKRWWYGVMPPRSMKRGTQPGPRASHLDGLPSSPKKFEISR